MLEYICDKCKRPYKLQKEPIGFNVFCPSCKELEIMKFRLDHFKEKAKEKECLETKD
jgi:uncharacterized Zn finger protein (UPF0148 family)